MSKQSELQAKAALVRLFIDQEIPPEATWNGDPIVLRDALLLLGTFCADYDAMLAAIQALFAADHNPTTGKNPLPPEWVADTGPPPVFIATNQLRLAGDRRADYAVGHRVRATLNASKVIVALTAVVFDGGTNTTLLTVFPNVLNGQLAALERALVRFSAPAVTALDLLADAVTTAAIAAGAVGSSELANLAILTQHLADLQVTAPKLALGAVGTPQLANVSVTATKIALLAVLGQHLADGAVPTRAILDLNVTEAKLADQAVSGRVLADQAVSLEKMGADLLERLATANLLRNGSFETFLPGASAPNGWTLSGGGTGAIATADTTDPRFGGASVRLRAGSVASYLQHSFVVSAVNNAAYLGLPVTLSVWVKTAVANKARLQIITAGSASASPYHSGDGTWQLLTLTVGVSFAASSIVVRLLNDATDSATAVLFDGAMLVVGTVPAAMFVAHPDDERVRAIRYQDRATNLLLGSVELQSGWTFTPPPGSGVTFFNIPVTFPSPFKQLLGASMLCVGFKDGADPVAVTDTDPFTATSQDPPRMAAHSLAVAGFTGFATAPSAGSFSTAGARRYVFSWFAWGVM